MSDNHFKGLDLKATYTLDSYSYNNIGLGIAVNAGKIVCVLADNLLEYRDLSKANSLSFNLDLILFSKTAMIRLKNFFY
jgi:hypothetical protein